MELHEFLSSPEFMVYMDDDLRAEAVLTAERISAEMRDEGLSQLKRSQLHSIASVVQGEGMAGVVTLADHQKEKNSRKEIKAFWTKLHDYLNGQDASALKAKINRMLLTHGYIIDHKTIQEKSEQNRQKSLNRTALETVMNHIAPVFFEHFICHYVYRAKGDRNA